MNGTGKGSMAVQPATTMRVGPLANRMSESLDFKNMNNQSADMSAFPGSAC